MATATEKVQTATSPGNVGHRASEVASLAFLTYQDRGGSSHGEIVDGSGGILAHSASFVSEGDAKRAAGNVREGARLARLQPRVTKERKTVSA